MGGSSTVETSWIRIARNVSCTELTRYHRHNSQSHEHDTQIRRENQLEKIIGSVQFRRKITSLSQNVYGFVSVNFLTSYIIHAVSFTYRHWKRVHLITGCYRIVMVTISPTSNFLTIQR